MFISASGVPKRRSISASAGIAGWWQGAQFVSSIARTRTLSEADWSVNSGYIGVSLGSGPEARHRLRAAPRAEASSALHRAQGDSIALRSGRARSHVGRCDSGRTPSEKGSSRLRIWSEAKLYGCFPCEEIGVALVRPPEIAISIPTTCARRMIRVSTRVNSPVGSSWKNVLMATVPTGVRLCLLRQSGSAY